MTKQTETVLPAQAYCFMTAHELQDLHINSETGNAPVAWVVDGDKTALRAAGADNS